MELQSGVLLPFCAPLEPLLESGCRGFAIIASDARLFCVELVGVLWLFGIFVCRGPYASLGYVVWY